MNTREIPLFPLNTVLFPGMPLHLHIFEPRYKEMVQKCLDEKMEFGILLLHETQLCQVGCTARITQILRQLDNGSMDILTEGRKRFRVLDVLNRESYLEAVVDYFEDDSEDIPSSLLKKVLNAYQKMIHLQTRGVGRHPGHLRPGPLFLHHRVDGRPRPQGAAVAAGTHIDHGTDQETRHRASRNDA